MATATHRASLNAPQMQTRLPHLLGAVDVTSDFCTNATLLLVVTAFGWWRPSLFRILTFDTSNNVLVTLVISARIRKLGWNLTPLVSCWAGASFISTMLLHKSEHFVSAGSFN